MATNTELVGTMHDPDGPDWAALQRLVDDDLAARFMHMFDVELEDGTRLHAYRDRMTRRYLHLTEDGRAFHYIKGKRYRELDPRTALLAVYVDQPSGGRLDHVEQAALQLALAKLDRDLAAG
jgi:hypothetical protein